MTSWTYESLHELVLTKFKSLSNTVYNSSKCYWHILLNSRDGNWTTSSTTKLINCCQHVCWMTTNTSSIIWIHATTTSSLRLWVQSVVLQCYQRRFYEQSRRYKSSNIGIYLCIHAKYAHTFICIYWNTSMRWSFISCKNINEKVEHHISEDKTHKPEP